MKGLFTLDWSNVLSAIVYGVMTALFTFILVVSQKIMDAGTIYGLDWHSILDQGAIATLGVLVTLVSILKNLLTNDKGQFLGVVPVIPDKTQ